MVSNWPKISLEVLNSQFSFIRVSYLLKSDIKRPRRISVANKICITSCSLQLFPLHFLRVSMHPGVLAAPPYRAHLPPH